MVSTIVTLNGCKSIVGTALCFEKSILDMIPPSYMDNFSETMFLFSFGRTESISVNTRRTPK